MNQSKSSRPSHPFGNNAAVTVGWIALEAEQASHVLTGSSNGVAQVRLRDLRVQVSAEYRLEIVDAPLTGSDTPGLWISKPFEVQITNGSGFQPRAEGNL